MNRMTMEPVDSVTPVHINTSDIPAFVSVNLAQAAFEAIHRAWEDPAIREDYERWKAERQSPGENSPAKRPRKQAQRR